jgi:hypothetical protein
MLRADGCNRRRSGERIQREGEILRRLKALIRRLLERATHDPLNAVWNRSADVTELRRIVLQNCCHGLSSGVAPEGPLPGHHLVEHGTEAEDVRTMIDVAATYLFRRHVADGAQHQTWFGAANHRRHHRCRAASRLAERDRLRQAEIEDLDAGVSRDEDVLRFQVAMNDAFLMRRGQAARDLHRDVDRAPRRQRSLRQPVAKRLAIEQLRDDEPQTALVADVIQREDIRMVQGRDGAGLLFEPAQSIAIRCDRCGKNLDGDVAMEAGVTSAIDFAHPAGTDRGGDLVRTEHRSGGKRHRLGFYSMSSAD